MKKVLPSEKRINRNANLLQGKEFSGIEDLLILLAEEILQKGLESEVTEYLGRSWYERRKDINEDENDDQEAYISNSNKQSQTGPYRNGYYPRRIKTIDGNLDLEIPRIRNCEEKYASKILENIISSLTGKVKKIVLEAILRGLSYRDVEETFTDKSGKAIISRGSMTGIMEEVNKELDEFRNSDLSDFDVVYLYFDGVYESVKKYTNNQTILCCWGISSKGEKRMLGLNVGSSESSSCWDEFMIDLKNRGLRQPLLITSDGSKGLISAIIKNFPLSRRQRCIAHKMRNIMNKLPLEAQNEIKTEVHNIYYANDRTEAEAKSEIFIKKYSNKYPEMIRCYMEDLSSCLEQLDFPSAHRKFIRTTNLIERAFVEEKRRTKIIPCHQNEKGMMNLVFGVLIRASKKWNKMNISELEKTLLLNIRKIMNPDYNDQKFISMDAA